MRFGTKEHSIQAPKCNGEAVLLGTNLVTNMEIIRFPSITHAFRHSMTKSLPETSFFRSAELLYSQAGQVAQAATGAVSTADLATCTARFWEHSFCWQQHFCLLCQTARKKWLAYTEV